LGSQARPPGPRPEGSEVQIWPSWPTGQNRPKSNQDKEAGFLRFGHRPKLGYPLLAKWVPKGDPKVPGLPGTEQAKEAGFWRFPPNRRTKWQSAFRPKWPF